MPTFARHLKSLPQTELRTYSVNPPFFVGVLANSYKVVQVSLRLQDSRDACVTLYFYTNRDNPPAITLILLPKDYEVFTVSHVHEVVSELAPTQCAELLSTLFQGSSTSLLEPTGLPSKLIYEGGASVLHSVSPRGALLFKDEHRTGFIDVKLKSVSFDFLRLLMEVPLSQGCIEYLTQILSHPSTEDTEQEFLDD